MNLFLHNKTGPVCKQGPFCCAELYLSLTNRKPKGSKWLKSLSVVCKSRSKYRAVAAIHISFLPIVFVKAC